ncbi:hypothetical protein GOODEAATRI_012830 [Goodea atripinnis]|uniref:Prolactin receptor n=1 Tax=Goodea atripinnis TaxID=208336 RepID=A0ABV0P3M1_9TELE
MEWKPRGRRQIDLLPKEAVESFWSPVSLVSCSEEFGNSSLNAPALSLHSASITKPSSQELPRPNHQPVCPPSNVIAPTSVELPGRKGNPSKGTQQLSSQNCAHPVSFKSPWEKDK